MWKQGVPMANGLQSKAYSLVTYDPPLPNQPGQHASCRLQAIGLKTYQGSSPASSSDHRCTMSPTPFTKPNYLFARGTQPKYAIYPA